MMLIWGKDNCGFFVIDNCKSIFITEDYPFNDGPEEIGIFADDIKLGNVESIKEADKVIRNIASSYVNGDKQCNPW